MKYKIFYIVTTFFVLFSCSKPQPQIPANRRIGADSTGINLRSMNEILIQKEDSLIKILIETQENNFEKTLSGIWYFKEKETTLDFIIGYPEITIRYEVFSLTGEKFDSATLNVVFEKKEIPQGLEEGLKLMRKGEKMQLIVPWYLAYGMGGIDNIPPYTSLMYEVETIQ